MRAPLSSLLAALVACNLHGSKGAPDASMEAATVASAPIDTIDAAPVDTYDAAPHVAAAKTTYATLCAGCHGPEARGYAADHAPSLVSPTFQESVTNEFLFRSIAEGRPGTAMAAYGAVSHGPLSDEQITGLVLWLRDGGAPPKALVEPGRAASARGGALYAKHCKSCHGDAKARGEGVSLGNPKFLALASRAFVRHAIVNGRPGTKMEAWGEPKLTAADIDALVAYVFEGLAAPDPDGDGSEGQLPAPRGDEPLVVNPGGKPPSFSPRSDPCPAVEHPEQKKPDAGRRCEPNRRYVPAAQVAQALADKRRMIIIDARPTSEWMRVHVKGAVSIPHHDPRRLPEIKNDGTWVIAYCACPHHLSGDIVDALRARGVKNSAILDEGILEWHRRGYPVVAARGVKPPPRQVGRH
ncbi:MAG TPA: c-type cytochrome [Polyangiaceae bacterium]|nr:c-type cytochrome [Polyangiaceae bacterium]